MPAMDLAFTLRGVVCIVVTQQRKKKAVNRAKKKKKKGKEENSTTKFHVDTMCSLVALDARRSGGERQSRLSVCVNDEVT